MNVVLAVIAFAAMLQRTEAVDYIVGDDLGWTIPPDGADTYVDWASQYTFVVDVDTLTFEFAVGEQDVAFVTQEDFDSCTTTNPLWISSEPARFTLNFEGTFHFIGTYAGHCAKGQKIAVDWTNSPAAMTSAQCPSPGPGPGPSPGPSPSPSPNPFAAAEAHSDAKLPLMHLTKRVNRHRNKKRVSFTMRGAT